MRYQGCDGCVASSGAGTVGGLAYLAIKTIEVTRTVTAMVVATIPDMELRGSVAIFLISVSGSILISTNQPF